MTKPYIRPDVVAFLDAAEASPAPPINSLPVMVARSVFCDMVHSTDIDPAELAVVRDLLCAKPDFSIPLRLYDRREKRDQPVPLILFFHGGGFVFGDLETHDSFCRTIASYTDLPVLAVDYRLAPEHRFPAAVEDAEYVARWLGTKPAELGFAPSGLVSCGDSAGGHLAIMVAQRLGAEPALLPVLAQWAIYPFLGGGENWDSFRRFGEGYMLTREAMDWFDDLFGKQQDDPRYALLTGPVPSTPLVILTASLDPLHDQGIAYALKAVDVGAKVQHIEAEGMIHGFVNLRRAMPSAVADLQTFFNAGLAHLPTHHPITHN